MTTEPYSLERDDNGFACAIVYCGTITVLQLNPGTTTNETFADTMVKTLNRGYRHEAEEASRIMGRFKAMVESNPVKRSFAETMGLLGRAIDEVKGNPGGADIEVAGGEG